MMILYELKKKVDFIIIAGDLFDSNDVDRKIRSVGELNLLLNPPETGKINAYVSVEQVYRRHMGTFDAQPLRLNDRVNDAYALLPSEKL